MDPVEWRPRERSAGANHLANCAMPPTCSSSGLSPFVIEGGVQVFTGGGCTTKAGAYGIHM
eukprot:4107732-Pyramimonas_sp.AAC.1